MIEQGLYDLRVRPPKRKTPEIPLTSKQIKTRNQNAAAHKNVRQVRRDSALTWIEANSSECMGFKWCLDYSEINPNFIRRMIKEIIEGGKTFGEVRGGV